MKRIFNLLSVTLLLIVLQLACKNKKTDVVKNTSLQKQNTEYLIKRIVFLEYNTSVPANFESHKYQQIEIANDSIFLIESHYKKGRHNETKTLKSIKLNANQKSIFFSLPNEYLKKDEYSIGHPSPLEEDKFEAIITLSNSKKIVWRMGEDRFPEGVQPFRQLYYDFRQKLYTKTD